MEDFVTFEIAKKLKEKGFKQGYNTFGYKPVFSDENTIKYISDIGAYENEYFGINIPCPTISQVLKWLREEKEIDIVIYPIDASTVFMGGEKYILSVYINRKRDYKLLHNNKYKYVEWKEAALAGIKYVLDNLI